MSTCVKTFIQNIGAPAYYAYFKMDEATGTTALVDQVGGFNLDIDSLTNTSVPGKIATAIDFGLGINHSWQNGPNTHWQIPGSFTIRFWINLSSTLGNTIFMNSYGFPDAWGITYQGSSDIMEFFVRTADNNAYVDTGILTTGSWHHMVFWYEAGVGVGCKVDNGASITTADASALDYPANSTLKLTATHWSNPGFALDEIAFWDHKLTDAEITADWNGGNGVTYP